MGKETNNLLARLGTYESLSEGQGLYVDFCNESELYKDKTFKEVINAMIGQALASEEPKYKEIASYIKMLITQDIPQANLEIRVYDYESNNLTMDNDKGVSLGLNDMIKGYTKEKEVNIDGKLRKVDYLDIIVALTLWD